ncbi:MAG: hypothetical protein AAFO69_02850 [Bacteroidota bacterium]
MKRITLTIILSLLAVVAFAQRGRPDPGQRIEMEKDTVLAKITTLSADQKMLLEAVYADAKSTVLELAGTAGADREVFRSKMRAINEDKNAQLKEILNDEQWDQFDAMLKEARQRRRDRQQNRGQRGRRNDGL